MEDGAAVFVCSNIFLAFVVHPGSFGTLQSHASASE